MRGGGGGYVGTDPRARTPAPRGHLTKDLVTCPRQCVVGLPSSVRIDDVFAPSRSSLPPDVPARARASARLGSRPRAPARALSAAAMASPPPPRAPRGAPPRPRGRAPRLHRPLRRDTAAFASRLCACARGACPTAEPWTPPSATPPPRSTGPNPCTSRARRAPRRHGRRRRLQRRAGPPDAPRRGVSRRHPAPTPAVGAVVGTVGAHHLPPRAGSGEAPTTEGEGAGEGRRAETFEMPVAELFGFADDDDAASASDRIRNRATSPRTRVSAIDSSGAARPSDGRRTSRGSCSFSTASTRASDSSRANPSPWSFVRTSPRAPASARRRAGGGRRARDPQRVLAPRVGVAPLAPTLRRPQASRGAPVPARGESRRGGAVRGDGPDGVGVRPRGQAPRAPLPPVRDRRVRRPAAGIRRARGRRGQREDARAERRRRRRREAPRRRRPSP